MSHPAKPLPSQARRQMIEQITPRYRQASFAQKILLLDTIVAATGYARKYAITLLNQTTERAHTIQQHPPLTPLARRFFRPSSLRGTWPIGSAPSA